MFYNKTFEKFIWIIRNININISNIVHIFDFTF